LKTAFKESFARDLKTVRNKKLLNRVKEAIEAVEQAETLTSLPQLKKLKGEHNYFRLRVGEYRIGVALEEDTIVFVRFLARKDIYRYFP
jgi:mRNA interferase RelE/StbE